MKMIPMLVLSISMVSFAKMSLADIYEIVSKRVAMPESRAYCEGVLTGTVEKLQVASGVQVIGSACERHSAIDFWDMRITYLAAQPLAIWTTRSHNGEVLQGYFSDLTLCEASLGQELKLVNAISGLKPFMSYCESVSTVGAKSYRTHIEAVGTSSVFKVESVARYARPLGEPQSVVENLCQQTAGLGLKVTQWNANSQLGMPQLAVGYYDDLQDGKLTSLGNSTLFKFINRGECLAGVSELKKIWSTQNLKVAFDCSPEQQGFSSHLTATFWGSEHADYDLEVTAVAGTFDDHATCQAKGASVLSQLTASGKKTLGFVCGRQGDDEKLVIVTKN
jgi:hypothetical protein